MPDTQRKCDNNYSLEICFVDVVYTTIIMNVNILVRIACKSLRYIYN